MTPQLPRPARVLRLVLAEPSLGTRERLRVALSGDPTVPIEIVAHVATGAEALRAIQRQHPHLTLLAHNLAEVSTVEVVRAAMADYPLPLLVTATPPVDASLAGQLLRAGVLDVVARPRDDATTAEWTAFGGMLRAHVRLLADIRVIRHLAGRDTPAPRPARPDGRQRGGARLPLSSPTPPNADGLPPVVAIVASTGGPPAVAGVLRSLAPCPHAAILLVQHIGSEFVDGLVRWLAREVPLPVGLAHDGCAPRPGHVYLAPAHAHLVARGGQLHLDRRPPVNYVRPSGDVLLASLAEAEPQRSVGIILTGLGSDGARGLLALRAAGGWTIAQDEATSSVWGMPQAAVELHAAAEVLPLAGIAPRVSELVAAMAPR